MFGPFGPRARTSVRFSVLRSAYRVARVPTVIAHLDIDAFYASVELLRRPELRGLPLVVSGSGPRAVVTTASYEARKFGVGSAMPTSRALRLCPDAVVIPPDFPAYREKSEVVMGLVRGTVDEVEVVGLDEAYLDLGGLLSPRATMRRLIKQIREATGLTASVGIGPNKLVAKVASDAEKPAGFVVLTREQACVRFAQHPPKLVPGIGAKTAERLQELGITTLAALADADLGLLSRQFGERQGPWLASRGRFEGSARVESVREAVSESRESTFDVDIADNGELQVQLHRLADQLCRGLQKHERAGRTIAIKVRLDDWTTVTRARTIAHPTNEVEHVGQVAGELLREYAPSRPVRLLGVRVASFGGAEQPVQETEQLALPM